MTRAHDEWARVKSWFVPLFEQSPFYNLEYVERQFAAEEMHLWAGERCAAITEFMVFPKCKALNIFAVAGVKGKSLQEIVETIEPSIEGWAMANGCAFVFGEGIKEAWRPVAERMGYRLHRTTMIKALYDTRH